VDGKYRAFEGQSLAPQGVFARSRREGAESRKLPKKCLCRFVRRCRGYALRSREGRERTTRRSPRAAADDADRRATRRLHGERIEVRVCRVARCAPRRPPDTPPRRWRWRKSRLGAVASERERSPETREEDALRTWTWKTASCGWTCGFGRGGDDGTRSAPGREARATRRRATDAGMSASCDDGGWETRSARVPDRRPRVARDASRSTNALGGHGHLAGHEGGGHGHGGHVCLGVWEGSGEVRALECVAHASAQPFYR